MAQRKGTAINPAKALARGQAKGFFNKKTGGINKGAKAAVNGFGAAMGALGSGIYNKLGKQLGNKGVAKAALAANKPRGQVRARLRGARKGDIVFGSSG